MPLKILLALLFLTSPCWATNYCSLVQGCWLFTEGSGTTVADGSGNSNTGTFSSSGHPAWSATVPSFATSGSAANSVLYASNDYINMGSGASIANVSPMTIVAWVYLTGTPSYSARIFNKQNSAGWLLDMFQSGATTLGFGVTYTTTNLSVVTSTSLSTSAWHMIALTWDGSTTAANVHIYIDNVEASYATQTDASGSRSDDTSQTLQIGNRDSDEARAFPGYITQVAIGSVVLNSTQLTEIYNYGLTGQPSPPSPPASAVTNLTNATINKGTLN